MKTFHLFTRLLLSCAVLLTATSATPVHTMHAQNAQALASLLLKNNVIVWQPAPGVAGGFALTVARPDGVVGTREFAPGSSIEYRVTNAPAGTYRYELRLTPQLDDATRTALRIARATGDYEQLVARLRSEGTLPERTIQSGSFLIAADGHVVLANALTESAARTAPQSGVGTTAVNDVVTADDIIVQSNACIGSDCVDNESFGFDTIRLKENNTRIAFDDTSATTGFTTNDWALNANDTNSGGLNRFMIEDVTNTRTPFSLMAGAPDNALFVAATGKIGLRTSTPALDIHMATSDTPALRFEQSGGAFEAQTWDIAGNEANFFIRDVTGGNRLPFRIRPGAPTSSLDISASGNVGVGTASPTQKLHVAGNVLVDGVLVEQSDVNAKHQIRPVDGADILSRLLGITVSSWSYKADPSGARHIGPMAQDFFAAFGLGGDDKHIAALNVNGVLLAAVQEISRLITSQSARIDALEAENAELRANYAALEQRISALEDAAP